MQKYQVPPIILRILGVLVITGLSLWLCFFIAERFFFDKLIYKKSPLHGYYNRWYYDQEKLNSNWLLRTIVQQREHDLIDLLNGKVWPKNTQVKTIAVIGDSYTYGVGVLSSERFSNYLAAEFKKLGVTAQVYNFSESGNSIMDDFALYQLAKKQLDPDLIVIGIVSNDLFFNPDRYPGDLENSAIFDKVCPQPLYSTDADFTSDNAAFFRTATETFDPQFRNRCYLTEIAKVLAQDQHAIYFNFSAKMSNSACHEQDRSEETLLMNTYMEILEAQGFHGLSHLTTDLSKWDGITQIEGHPSREAHRKFAREISRFGINYLR